ncbi:hypothetical protein [Rhodococcus kronopolitis]|uniref:Uncharacterized protein n=1 Tax=Rhodococcus kronopolitis TaxID=1460226 RepID=A0ABV9FUC4_9NOCA
MNGFDPEVPEADAVEQATPADHADEVDEADAPPTSALEVNVADAAEQQRGVPEEDEYPHS